MLPRNIILDELKKKKKHKDHCKDVLLRPGSSKRLCDLYYPEQCFLARTQFKREVMMLKSAMGLLQLFDSKEFHTVTDMAEMSV